jgi:hypothetical protein
MIVEIRTYRLKPGSRDEFVRVMREEGVPLLTAYGIEVLEAGPSMVDVDGHQEAYLIRVFESVEHREKQETGFYCSEAWVQGPREAIVSRIESYHTVVVDGALFGY